MAQNPHTPSGNPATLHTGTESMSEVQAALLQLREGLMTLKDSLLELARRHEEELGMHQAQAEADALLHRLRHPS